jgi:glycosyltransferase involved in cell wall biosynthesis
MIHAHFGLDGVLALPLARSLRIPLIVTFHGFDATIDDEYASRSYFVHRKFVRQRENLKKGAQLFIAVSKFIKANLLALGFPPEKIIVHYIGVDLDIFKPSQTIKREPMVLFVGRLIERKGCQYLIRAMAEVQTVKPHVRLSIIGDGPFRPYLEKLSKELLRNYEFLGAKPIESVKSWLNRAKIFGGPSITVESGEAEGFGMVLAEAQAMGVPVVGFRSGGIPEAVSDGVTGFLAPERNWRLLAKNIFQLLDDELLWSKFSKKGRERVNALFNLHTQTQSLEDIYFDVLRRNVRKPVLV